MTRNRNYKKAPKYTPKIIPSTLPRNKDSPLRVFSQNLMAGMSLGTGSELAHIGMNRIMNTSDSDSATKDKLHMSYPNNGMKYPTKEELALKKCILDNRGDIWHCQEVFEKYANSVIKEI